MTARGLGRLRWGCVRVITLHHLSTSVFFPHLTSPPCLTPPFFLPVDTSLLSKRRRQCPRLLPLWLDAICAFRDTGDMSCSMHLPCMHKHEQTAHKQYFLISEALVSRVPNSDAEWCNVRLCFHFVDLFTLTLAWVDPVLRFFYISLSDRITQLKVLALHFFSVKHLSVSVVLWPRLPC